MKKSLFVILLAGISFSLFAQKHTSDIATSEACFKTYMELKSNGMYEASDKWMIRFASTKPNDLRAKDYNQYRSEQKNLLLDNGNYTIVSLKHNKSLKVNTEGDELYPCFKEDGHILFFSSNGRFGLGGLDIFIYAINFTGYGKVYNAGYPLNSRFDEYALVVNDQVRLGYFKSNRSHGRGYGN